MILCFELLRTKFLTLRVTPPAHPVQARAAKWPKIPPTWHQNGSKMEPKWSQLGTKMEQNGAKMGHKNIQNRGPGWVPHRTARWGTHLPFEKKSVPKSNATKKGPVPHSGASFWPKKWPTWLQVELQNRSKINKNRYKNRSFF